MKPRNHIYYAIGTLYASVVCSFFSFAESEIHASPAGTDNANGSIHRPYSITEALVAASQREVSEIILADGRYEIDQTIDISIQRTEQSRLTVRAKNTGKAIISGGYKLTSPTQDRAGKLRFSTNNIPDINNSRDLYVGKDRAIRARSATYSAWNDNFSAIPGFAKKDKNSPTSIVSFPPSYQVNDHTGETIPLSKWEKPSDLEFVFRCAWWEKRCGVASITGEEIEFVEPAWSIINEPWATEANSRLNAEMPKTTFLEGAVELLDSPGEWHNSGEYISLIPTTKQKEKNDPIIVGRLERLVSIRNSSGLNFIGVQFAHTTWRLPIETSGFNEGQANFEQVGKTGSPPEALGIYESANISFKDCTFTQLGGWGLGVFQRSKDISIDSCNFLDIAGNAIVIGSVRNDAAIDSSLQTKNVSVTNSWIHKPASIYRGGVGIFVGYASNVSITDNEVCHAPYTGISMGWGWNSLDTTEVEIKRNTISGNYVHHYLYDMYDGGGIYTLGPQSNPSGSFEEGLQITNNTIHNQGGIGNILYSDGGSRWITLSENTTFNNLRELENYYDEKAMYVPDWGGCSPFGDLIFKDNTLGNVQSRSPNFRCAPQDPEPWSREFKLPNGTKYVENTFSARSPVPEKRSQVSEGRHKILYDEPDGLIANFECEASDLTFTLHCTDSISFSSTPLPGDSSFQLHVNDKRIEDWKTEKSKTILEAGQYRLTLNIPAAALSPMPTPTVHVSSEKAGISRISARTNKISFGTKNAIPQKFLGYATGNTLPAIAVKTNRTTKLKESDSWLQDSHHWQTLRAFLDAKEPLPNKDTPALVLKLPEGRYSLESQENSSSAKMILVTNMGKP